MPNHQISSLPLLPSCRELRLTLPPSSSPGLRALPQIIPPPARPLLLTSSAAQLQLQSGPSAESDAKTVDQPSSPGAAETKSTHSGSSSNSSSAASSATTRDVSEAKPQGSDQVTAPSPWTLTPHVGIQPCPASCSRPTSWPG